MELHHAARQEVDGVTIVLMCDFLRHSLDMSITVEHKAIAKANISMVDYVIHGCQRKFSSL